ncbi:MAG: HU family DNA-binding protein [bacterium]
MSRAVNRAEIVQQVAEATGLTQSEVSAVLEGILKVIEMELVRGGSVELRRFGTFKLTRRAPRVAVNPKTGRKTEVPVRWVPWFKPSPQLKAAVRQTSDRSITDKLKAGG